MKKYFYILFILALLCNASLINAQRTISKSEKKTLSDRKAFKGYRHLFSGYESYVIPYTSVAPVIDGNIFDEVWQKAGVSNEFVDIEGDVKPEPYHSTFVKMLWDDNYLYIAALLDETHVWAYQQNHDQVVFFDNDFEIFIDPENTAHRYFEIEVNALNTVFDLFLPKPYRVGSGALISWGGEGLKHAVQIYGSLNNPSNTDDAWTVEMAIPFKDITIGNNPILPKDGDIWRMNFSRVQWETEVVGNKYVKKKDATGKNLPEHNWVWSPQGVINMHLPERWGYVQFSTKEVGSKQPEFDFPYTENQRAFLWLTYYKQQAYKDKHGEFAKTLKVLEIPQDPVIDGHKNELKMEATSNQFSATISDVSANATKIRINDEGYVTPIP